MQKKNFNLDKNFYQESFIDQAISDFADFRINKTDLGVEITDEDPQMVFDEFSNYILSLALNQ